MDMSKCDLIVDQIYEGGRNGNASDDPLPRLVGVSNGAGFRHLGKLPSVDTMNLLVLKSNFNDSNWPDQLNTESGLFTYYGDNKSVGDIHSTPRKGNLILRNLFDARHSREEIRKFPPILLFGGTGEYRDVRFLGLAVPGAYNLGSDEDLVAIWRAKGLKNERFQNYKSVFTVLDVPRIRREWLHDIKMGRACSSSFAPKAWLNWIKARVYQPLYAPHSIDIRTKDQQIPSEDCGDDLKVLNLVYDKFKEDPFKFEHCAVQIARLMMPDIGSCEITRPWRDGGRDATGTYKIGTGASAIEVDFALEAKCYKPGSSVGVKELSRLLSRLRHRQFGVLVTTSYLASQAYKELKTDNHPVVIISASDIVGLLKHRIGSTTAISHWLDNI